MKWNGETKEQKRKRKRKLMETPQRKFALFPTQASCGTWIWLEWYLISYQSRKASFLEEAVKNAKP